MNFYGYLLIVLGIVVILLVLMMYILYRKQERLIFYPETLPNDYKFDFEQPIEELNFNTRRGVSINALLFKAKNSKGLIIYCHGNAGSIASWGHRANDFLPHSWDVLVWDYRGYGKSTGKIKREKMVHNDADFIYHEMLKKYDKEKINFVGCSLGTGVAAKLAVQYPSSFLILITPYFNFKHTVDHHYPFIPTSMILKYRFKTNEYLQDVTCPVILLHGTNDQTVPYESSIMLSHLNPDKIKLVTIQGGSHNNLPEYPLFQETVKKALNSAI